MNADQQGGTLLPPTVGSKQKKKCVIALDRSNSIRENLNVDTVDERSSNGYDKRRLDDSRSIAGVFRRMWSYITEPNVEKLNEKAFKHLSVKFKTCHSLADLSQHMSQSSLDISSEEDRDHISSVAYKKANVLLKEESEMKRKLQLKRKQNLFRHLFTDIIPVDNRPKRLWDWVIILLIVYTVIDLPIRIAFFGDTVKDDFKWAVIDIFFLVDIYLNFRTAFLDTDRYEVTQRAEIVWHYLRGRFILDLVAALPTDLVAAIFGVSRDHRAHSVLMLFKLLRFFHFMFKVDNMINSATGRITRLLFTFCLAAHVIGCGFYALGRFQTTDESGNVVVGGGTRWTDRLEGQPFYFQYATSVYWAYATLATVGYGDVSATSGNERIFAVVTMLVGSVLYAAIFGTFTSVIQNIDRHKEEYNSKSRDINDFCRANQLPSFIRKRLLDYHEASWQLRKLSANHILNDVPESTQMDLMMLMYADLVVTVPMFSEMPTRFLEKMVMSFRHVVFLSGDFIVRQGDIGRDLYFVVSGEISISVFVPQVEDEDPTIMDFDEVFRRSVQIRTAGPGAFVGEIALVNGRARTASVMANKKVQTVVLSKDDFDRCVAESPEVAETLKGVASIRAKNDRHATEASSSSSSSPQEKKSNARFQEQMHSEYQKRTTENSIGSGGGSMEYNFSTNVRKGLRRMSTAISPFVPSSPMTSSRVQPSSFETNVRILSRDFIESDIK